VWRKAFPVLAAAIGFAVAAAVVLAVAGPSSRRVERSIHVEASPEVAAAQITDLHRWLAWSPREPRDPGARRSYGGPATGVGSTYYWESAAGLGRGRLTVLSETPGRIELEREMEEPRAVVDDLEFRLEAEGSGTRLTWIQSGPTSLAERLLALWDPGSGTDAELEHGLERLKAVAEAEARVKTYRIEREARVNARPDAVLGLLTDLHRWTAWWPRESLDPAMRRSYGETPNGPGSSYFWSGNASVGQGRLSILSSSPEGVVIEMETDRPHPASVDLEFRVSPDGAGTRVLGTVTGQRADAGPAREADPEPVSARELEEALSRLAAHATGSHGRTR
jgi:hypothetical protein